MVAAVLTTTERQENYAARVSKTLGISAQDILRDSVVIEQRGGGVAVLRAEVIKFIPLAEAQAMIDGDPITEED